jgi:hypothetical protein
MTSTLAPECISVIISVAVIATKFNAFRSGFDAAYRLHHADQQTVLDCVALVDRLDALILSS